MRALLFRTLLFRTLFRKTSTKRIIQMPKSTVGPGVLPATPEADAPQPPSKLATLSWESMDLSELGALDGRTIRAITYELTKTQHNGPGTEGT